MWRKSGSGRARVAQQAWVEWSMPEGRGGEKAGRGTEDPYLSHRHEGMVWRIGKEQDVPVPQEGRGP